MRARVRIPATTANCGPGFDTLGIACTLYNEVLLEMTETTGQIEIGVSGDGADSLPVNDRNLVLRSVRAVFEKAGKQPSGIRLTLRNNIPLSRGLGSSSAAIVGGVVAANAVLGGKFSPDELLDLATKLEGHPDNVAPALLGGFTISVMQGGQVVCLRLPVPEQLQLVVCIPDFRLSTNKARQAIPASVPHRDAVYNVSRAALLVGAMASGQIGYLADALDDKLHQPYRAALIPGMMEVFAAGKAAGALGVAMSGAGPSLMAYTTEKVDAIGEAMVQAFKKYDVSSRYLCLGIDYQGARIVDFA
ncbi:MAG: homoserine kinase [Veillonellaceae bacterium]|nr:homoserine kinase [Veillonellaceae bacterium]